MPLSTTILKTIKPNPPSHLFLNYPRTSFDFFQSDFLSCLILECCERPRKRGAAITKSDIVADDIIKDIKFTYDSKRHNWNGYVRIDTIYLPLFYLSSSCQMDRLNNWIFITESRRLHGDRERERKDRGATKRITRERTRINEFLCCGRRGRLRRWYP